jgi:hypothetical protein
MKGRKWEVCQHVNISAEKRDALLSAYQVAAGKANTDPGIIEKAINYTKSTIKHIKGGMVEADEGLKRIRLQTCESCDQLTNERSCRACGCPVEAKASRKSEACPLLKWPGDAERGNCGCGS